MRLQSPVFLALLLGFIPVFAAGKSVVSGRTALVQEVDLTRSVVTLADLLPGTASPELRTEGLKVMLGVAPQSGAERQITRQELDRALADRPELQEDLILPETVTIRRRHRQITPAELRSVVIDALKRRGVPDSELAKITGMDLSAPIYVTEADPGLQVMSIEYDALHEETLLRLWTAREPQLLPFCVSLRGRIGLPAQAGGRQAQPQQVAPAGYRSASLARAVSSEANSSKLAPFESVQRPPAETAWTARRPISAAEVLVKAGIPSKLYFDGAGFRIETEVIPLESGAEGQVIKVRRQDNRRLLTGEVVGPGLLQAN